MRDVISNETIKEINEVIDEILTNIDDNVRNIVGAGNYSLPAIFSYTNYSGQTVSVHGSTFRHEIIIDNADGNNLIGDICTVIGDKNGIKLAKAGVEDRHDTFANYWDSTFDIAYDSDTAINGYVFDMQSGFVGEGTGQSKIMSFKLDNLEVGKAYTLTFRGKFVHAQFVSGQESLVRICSTTAETPYLAQVTLEKDTDAHIYRIDFTNNTQDTTLYLNFWFYGVADDTETYHSEFIADDLIIAGMNIGIISRYIDYNGKWYPIEAGGGTSDLDAIELTYAEYQALTPAEKTDPDKIYFITDYPSGSGVVINPTGTATDTAETIEVDGTIYDFMDADAVHTADIGVAGGVAELDSNGKVPSSQLPSYVDDVVEGYYDSNTDRFYEESTFTTVIPPTGGKSWVDVLTNKSYRWTGSVYARVDEGVQLGETSSTAYRGDRGKIAYDHSQSDHSGIAPAFTEASTRANIASGETFATLLGKIKKFFSDLKAVAFSGSYNDLSNQPTKLSDFTDDVVAGNYLSKNGGTVGAGTVATPLEIKGTSEAWVKFIKSDGTTLGWIGVNQSGEVQFYDSAGHSLAYKSDLSSYLPLTGGTIFKGVNTDTPLYIKGNSGGAYIGFYNSSDSTLGYYGIASSDSLPYFYRSGLGSKRIALLSEVPSKTSELTNDSNFVSGSYSGFAKRLSLDFWISGSSMQGKWYTVLSKGYNYSPSQELIIHISNLNYSHSNGTSKMFLVHMHYRNLTIHPIGADANYVNWMVDWRTTYDSSNLYLEFKVKTDIGADSANQFRISYITLADNTSFTIPTSLVESSGRTVIDTYTVDANFRAATLNDTVAAATKATQDGDGNNISSTYMKVSTQPTQIFNKIPTNSAVTSTISSIANYKFLIFNITSNAYRSINWGSYIIPVAIVSSNYGSSYNGIIVRSMLNTSQYVEIAFLSATSVSIKGTNWQNSERVICYAY